MHVEHGRGKAGQAQQDTQTIPHWILQHSVDRRST